MSRHRRQIRPEAPSLRSALPYLFPALLAVGAGAIIVNDLQQPLHNPEPKEFKVSEKPLDRTCLSGDEEISRQLASAETPPDLIRSLRSEAVYGVFTFVTGNPDEMIIFCK